MTSGVTQALPQMPAPKAGIEDKAARKGAPHGDFASALALDKPAGVGRHAAEPDSETRPSSWPRVTPKFNGATNAGAGRLPDQETPQATGEATGEAAPDVSGDVLPDEHRQEPPARGNEEALSRVAVPDPTQGVAVPPIAAAQVSMRAEARPAETPATIPAKGTTGIDAESAFGQDISSPPDDQAKAERPKGASFTPFGRSEQAEPIRFEPAVRPSPITDRTPADRAQAKDMSPPPTAENATNAPRVTVLAQHNIPAPASSTALSLVDSIVGGKLLENASPRHAPEAVHASATHASAQSLKIQLRPAELGMVTATLRFTGEQLSIELQVENQEAYRRLSTDSESIVGSLRSLGYDVDKVTVLQPGHVSASAARADAPAPAASGQGRSAEQFGSGMANGGSGGSGGRSSEQGASHGQGGQRNTPQAADPSGGELYI
ncbi:flagellar hook-length control protein FliK [Mesorhizobium sp. ZMM04-5]|uniref:Flagellar hook-length control protein FliK n=1 Tax=Mesorhizobium marinum TaxID=3228790 RepID=A0ABV3QTS3_9HYPH